MAGFFENIANKIKEQKQERLARQKEEEIHVLASISFMRNNANMSYDKVLQILNEILGQYSRLSITRFVKMHAIQQIMLDVMMKKEITAQYIEKCVAGYPSTFIYYLWWNKDKTYQLQLCPININSPTCEFDVTYLHRSNDQPKKIILPSHFYGNKIVSLGDYRSSGGFHHLSVEEIIIPETIKVVQKYVFQDCTNLKKVTFLGNDLVTIERGAFLGCTELTEITLPSSLKNLDLMSFSQCPNLKNINISTETNVINAGESSVPNISTIKYYN